MLTRFSLLSFALIDVSLYVTHKITVLLAKRLGGDQKSRFPGKKACDFGEKH